jgi:hypothetical protein
MIRTQIQLTEEQSRRLKKLAEKENASVAELIRRSVDSYLEERHVITEEKRRERLLSVIGIGRSGITDLAKNHDKYLVDIYAEAGE